MLHLIFIDFARYHFLVSTVIKYSSTSTIVIVVLRKTHTNNTLPPYLLNFIHIHGLITINLSTDHLAPFWQVNCWCNCNQRWRAFLQERNPRSRKKNWKSESTPKRGIAYPDFEEKKKTRWQIVRKTKSVHGLLCWNGNTLVNFINYRPSIQPFKRGIKYHRDNSGCFAFFLLILQAIISL